RGRVRRRPRLGDAARRRPRGRARDGGPRRGRGLLPRPRPRGRRAVRPGRRAGQGSRRRRVGGTIPYHRPVRGALMTASTVATGPGAAGAATAGAGRGGAARAGAAGAAGIPAALTPGGAQAVFRATLDALARPGTVQRLPTPADQPPGAHVPRALLRLLALADLSTPACVVASAVARVEDGEVDGAAETDAAPVAGEVGSG